MYKSKDGNAEKKILDLTKWWALYQKENYLYIDSFDDIEFYSYFKDYIEEVYCLVVEKHDTGFLPQDLMNLARKGTLVVEANKAKEQASKNKEEFAAKEQSFKDLLEAKKNNNEKIRKMKQSLRIWWKSANANLEKQIEFEEALEEIPEILYAAAVVAYEKKLSATNFATNNELTISEMATSLFSVKSNHQDFDRKEQDFLTSINGEEKKLKNMIVN